MQRILYILFLISNIAVRHSKAEELIDATFYFTRVNGCGCNKFENAALRAATNLALSISQQTFAETTDVDIDDYPEVVLDQHEEEVPHVQIINYNNESQTVDLDIKAGDMSTFIENNTFSNCHGIADSDDDSDDINRNLRGRKWYHPQRYKRRNKRRKRHDDNSKGKESNKVVVWNQFHSKCCKCRICNCCRWAGCRDQCYRRSRRMTAAEKHSNLQREELVRQIGFDIFKALNVSCINAEDLRVMIT